MDAPANYPVLSVQPDSLDFSQIDHKRIKEIVPKTILIKNAGGEVLAGQVIPQAKWIDITPRTFNLLGGETSQHIIHIVNAPPHYWTKKSHHASHAIIVNSNSGQVTVSIHYTLPNLLKLKPTMPGRKFWFSLVILIILVIAGITVMYMTGGHNKTKNLSREMILSMGAETIFAGQTQTLKSSVVVTSIISPLPEVFSFMDIPQALTETTPTPQITYTPWPADQFPPPENLIYTYYSLLNNRDFDQAWSVLSESFQQDCCNEGPYQPIENYKAWWETIERVEILSGQIIQAGANPLEIQIKLKYFLKSGGVLEDENVFSIIADSQNMRLLIDKVVPSIEQ